jgi:hypothetical protein
MQAAMCDNGSALCNPPGSLPQHLRIARTVRSDHEVQTPALSAIQCPRPDRSMPGVAVVHEG